MTISCQALFNNAVNEVGSGPTDRLTEDFPVAFNRTSDELSLKADKASRISHIAAVDATISEDAEYEWIWYAGVIYNLTRMGHKSADPKIALETYKDTRDRWNEAVGYYIASEDNSNQASDSNPMIGLQVTSDT